VQSLWSRELFHHRGSDVVGVGGLPPALSAEHTRQRGSQSRIGGADRAAARSVLDGETGGSTRAEPTRRGTSRQMVRAVRYERLRFNPLLTPVHFQDPNHPGGIASPWYPSAVPGCPVYHAWD